MKAQYNVGVIGGGSWGTALAVVANRAGSKVCLATRNRNVVDAVRETRVNEIYLPGTFIDPAIDVTDNFAEVCKSDIVIMAMPSHCVRSACIAISDLISPNVPLAVGSKGIERGSLLMMSEVIDSVLPSNTVAIVSGPNFAEEAARGQPTATTVACADEATGEAIVYAIGGRLFRPYLTDDVIGTQAGGAIKNVIAIACGIAEGREMGENTRSALITRGFAEMARFALAKGGRMETLAGLSGLGDLVLTCSSMKSRNMSLGVALGSGLKAQDVIMGEGRGVLEGAVAAESVVKLARKHGIDMPICEAVHKVINEKADVEQVISGLLERPFAPEIA